MLATGSFNGNYYGAYSVASNGDNLVMLSDLSNNAMASFGIPAMSAVGAGDMLYR